jgi:hypothetical protein
MNFTLIIIRGVMSPITKFVATFNTSLVVSQYLMLKYIYLQLHKKFSSFYH